MLCLSNKLQTAYYNYISIHRHQYVSYQICRKFIISDLEHQQKEIKTITNSSNIEDQSHYLYNIVYPSTKIQCDQCKRQVSKAAKILTHDSDYCVACFAKVQSFPQQYNVINKLDYPLLDPNWTADEELMLFQGLQKHGFGNWQDIAQMIATNKTKTQVQLHYLSYFLQSPQFIPKGNVLTVRDETGRLIQTGIQEHARKSIKPSGRIFNHNTTQSFQRGSLTVNQMSVGLKTGNIPMQIVGYMPKRGDFEVQFDNDAQLLLAEMEFNEDDSEQAKQMKFRLMEIYNQKVDQRMIRKQFVTSRKLLDAKEQIRLDKTRTKEEKQIYNMMKVFARFSAPEEHEQLVQGFIKEKQIRAKIQQLRDLKKKGFQNIVDLSSNIWIPKKKEEKVKKDPLYQGNDKKTLLTLSHKKSKKQFFLEKSSQSHSSTPQQLKLCEKFNISLKEYELIKQSIIRQSFHQGIISVDQVSKEFKVNRNTITTILDFIVQKQALFEK